MDEKEKQAALAAFRESLKAAKAQAAGARPAVADEEVFGTLPEERLWKEGKETR